MFLIRDSVCVAGGQICEDAVSWGKNFCVALDGASGLSDECIMDSGSDAAWLAVSVSRLLKSQLDRGDKRPTVQILSEILEKLRGEYGQAAATRNLQVPPDPPSACIALFRQIGDELEFYGLGDTVGVVRLKDGTTVCSEERMLAVLDGRVVEKMKEIHRRTGIDVLAARPQCTSMLREHRTLKNTPDGYWILNLSGEGLLHARQGHWKLSDVDAVGVCSDGFYQMVDCFGQYPDGGEMLCAMQRTPLAEMNQQLFAAQERDPVCNGFPRLKFRDDSCALWAEICPDRE